MIAELCEALRIPTITLIAELRLQSNGLPKRSKLYQVGIGEVRSAILTALTQCGFVVREELPDSIRASAGASLRSWGEDISITVSQQGNAVEVTMSVEPKAQIFDWGKSSKDLFCFFAALNSLLLSNSDVN